MNTIICTAGTSIAKGGQRENESKEQFLKRMDRKIKNDKENAKTNFDFLVNVSAETHSLAKIKLEKEDEIILLYSDTYDGEVCAKKLQGLIIENFNVNVMLIKVNGLQTIDAKKFRKEAIASLYNILDKYKYRENVLLNTTGGFKSLVPYLTLYGMMNNLKVVYVFEFSKELIYLPPAPVNFDYSRLLKAYGALKFLKEEEIVKEDEFFNKLNDVKYSDREYYTSLIEYYEIINNIQYVIASPFARLFFDDIDKERVEEVYLSSDAVKDLEKFDSVNIQVIYKMIEKIQDPILRKSKYHSFKNNDLLIYKDGNVPERFSFYEKSNKIYICNIWIDHDRYERDGSKKAKNDFKNFVLIETVFSDNIKREKDLSEVSDQETNLEKEKKKFADELLKLQSKLRDKNVKVKNLESEFFSQKKEIKRFRNKINEQKSRIRELENKTNKKKKKNWK